MADRQKIPENIIPMILDLHPVVVEAGKNLYVLLRSGEVTASLAQHLRKEAALSLGIVVPSLKVRENHTIAPNDFLIKIREVMVYKGEVRNLSSADSVVNFLKEKLYHVIERYAYEFLGPEEVQQLLEHLRSTNPRVVQAVYPSLLTLSEIQRILQNLLKEGVPIRDLVRILEVLADSAPHTRDPEILTEYVRHSMPRVLGGLYHQGFVIKAYVLEEKIEQWISAGVRWENQVILDLNPEAARKILKALRGKCRSPKGKSSLVLLVSPEIRRFVKMLTERAFPELPVLSYNEIAPEYRVKVLGTIRMEPWKDRLENFLAFLRIKEKRPGFPGDDIQKAILLLNFLGGPANGVAQYLPPWEREALTARSMIAPIPTQGTDEVIDEFISMVPPEKKVEEPEDLIAYAGREPASFAAILQNNWLSRLPGQESDTHPFGFIQQESGGRDETSAREKAAIFITSAARWIQDEVYRYLTTEELQELGQSMLQFPAISSEGKRRAWEEFEGFLYKDEWWDPDTLVRFLRASMKGELEEFKKRGFRQTQKLAILLLSLPTAMASRIGKTVLSSLTKGDLHPVLAEMGQWRDFLPPETRLSVLQEFLDYASHKQSPEPVVSQHLVEDEVERIALMDAKGTAAVLRDLWLALRDPRATFETLALRTPGRITRLLLSYLRLTEGDRGMSPRMKLSTFINSLEMGVQDNVRGELNDEEKEMIKPPTGVPMSIRNRVFQEFLRGYYGGTYPSPIPFLKKN